MNVMTPIAAKTIKQPIAKFNHSVSCICWAYNEELLIRDFLLRLSKLLSDCVEDYEIVIVDDGSVDRTKEIILEVQKTIPCIVLVENAVNRNVGYCLRRSILCASKEFLFWQTVDWSYDISQLRAFLEFLKEFDIVVGVRRAPVLKTNLLHKRLLSFLRVFGIQHITKRSDTIPKAIVSLLNYFLIRLLFCVPISDYQNVVFFPTQWIQKINAEATSSFTNPELLIKSHWSGMSIKEVPISFIPRTLGTAKGTRLKSIISSVTEIFRLWFRWNFIQPIDRTSKGRIVRLKPGEWKHL